SILSSTCRTSRSCDLKGPADWHSSNTGENDLRPGTLRTEPPCRACAVPQTSRLRERSGRLDPPRHERSKEAFPSDQGRKRGNYQYISDGTATAFRPSVPDLLP